MKNRQLKKLLLGACMASLLLGTAACSRTTAKETESSSEEEAKATEAPIDYNEDESSNLGHWARAMGSVLIYLNDGNPYYFGGYAITEDNQAAACNILSGSWGIENREDLLEQIQILLQTGDRVGFQKEAREMNNMSKKQLKLAMKQLKGELLYHYQMVQYNWDTWKKKGLMAWDMCRVSHLVQWGYVADYLSREEAQALIEPAAKKLKNNFENWDEVQNNWLDGYCLFANIDRNASNTDYTNRLALYKRLADGQDENAPLYDDTLFSEDIRPVSSVSYRTIFKEIKEDKGKKKKKNKKKGNSEAEETATPEQEVSEQNIQ